MNVELLRQVLANTPADAQVVLRVDVVPAEPLDRDRRAGGAAATARRQRRSAAADRGGDAVTRRTLLALLLAAAAGAWPFATSFGPVVVVLSARHGRGVHMGDLVAVALGVSAVVALARGRRHV